MYKDIEHILRFNYGNIRHIKLLRAYVTGVSFTSNSLVFNYTVLL